MQGLLGPTLLCVEARDGLWLANNPSLALDLSVIDNEATHGLELALLLFHYTAEI